MRGSISAVLLVIVSLAGAPASGQDNPLDPRPAGNPLDSLPDSRPAPRPDARPDHNPLDDSPTHVDHDVVPLPGADWTADVAPAPISLVAGDVSNLGAPAWLKPGVRLTYFNAGASIVTSGYQLIEDPDGAYEDPATHKKYRKTDDNPKPGDQATASGVGYTQTDIVSVGKNAVAYSFFLYTMNGPNRTDVVPSTGGGAVGHVACPSDLWIHPKALAGLESSARDGYLILRGQRVFDGRKVDTIGFVRRDGASYASWTYDVKTGLLLASSTSTPAAKTGGPHLTGQAAPTGNTQITSTYLVSVRQTRLPYGGPVPDYMKNVRSMDFAGTFAAGNPQQPGMGMIPFEMAARYTFDTVGERYAAFTLDSVVRTPVPTQSRVACVTGSWGVLGVNPAVLAECKPNQLFDEDPVTLIKIFCGDVTDQTVTLVQARPQFTSALTYDRHTGQLVGIDETSQTAGTRFVLSLQPGR